MEQSTGEVITPLTRFNLSLVTETQTISFQLVSSQTTTNSITTKAVYIPVTSHNFRKFSSSIQNELV